MKFGRRQILLAGLTFAVVVTETRNIQQIIKKRKLQALAREQSQKNLPRLLNEAFEADAKKINQTIKIQESLKLTPPKIPYNRSISKLLIQCSKLGTQQYLAGKVNPSFNGSIKSLPAYTHQLDSYTQLAFFKGLEDARSSQTVEVDIPQKNTQQTPTQDPVENNLDDASKAIGDSVQQTVKLKQLIPVYFGFVLTSKKNNIIVFRGTQRTTEWIGDIWLFQKVYKDLQNTKIHSGFADIYYKTLAEQVRKVASQLNPSVPCYISGHSLGSALATLAAIDIAQNVPKLKNQVQLYTYAGPRVGDPAFAKFHSRLVPNSYRIVNLADSIPLSPPTIFRKDVYVHVGQPWSFLKQNGDVLPNHAVDTYRAAINSEAESNK